MTDRPLIIASNRGPVSFVRGADGQVEQERGAGGLVTALTGALQPSGGLWLAAAMSEEDRVQAALGRVDVAIEDARFSLRYLAIEPSTPRPHGNRIAGSTGPSPTRSPRREPPLGGHRTT